MKGLLSFGLVCFVVCGCGSDQYAKERQSVNRVAANHKHEEAATNQIPNLIPGMPISASGKPLVDSRPAFVRLSAHWPAQGFQAQPPAPTAMIISGGAIQDTPVYQSPKIPAPKRRPNHHRAYRVRVETVGSDYTDMGGGHWIESVMDDGSLIKLEDDSLWQISPFDTIDSQLWLAVSDITVIDGDDPFYPYKLVNTDDNEVVNARLISQ